MKREFGLAPILLLICLAILTACTASNDAPAASPTRRITPASAKADQIIPTVPTKPSASLRTPSPAATPTQTDAIFDDHAPAWLIACLRHKTESQIAAYNPDGSAVKNLLPVPVIENFCQVAAPSAGKGSLVAVVTAPIAENSFPTQANLSIIQMPEGRVIQVINLINPEKIQDTPENPYMMVLEAVGFNAGMSWSPDGSTLAFIGALDGPSADVYLYHAKNGEVTRISQEPDQASGLTWSPDGRFVVYQQVASFGGGGSDSKGVWSADGSTASARRLLDTGHAALTFDGWTKDGYLIAHPWSGRLAAPESGGRTGWLQRIDPQTGAVDYLLPPSTLPAGSNFKAAYNPGDDWIGLAVEYPTDAKVVKALDGSLTKSVTWGPQQFWAIPTVGGTPKMLFSETSTRGIGIDIAPSGLPGHWIARYEYSQFNLGLDGKGPTLDATWFAPVVSPDRAWLAFYAENPTAEGYQTGLRLVAPDGATRRIITQAPVSSVLWRPDGQGLLFVSNETLFYLPIDQDTPIAMRSGVFAYLLAPNLTPLAWVIP